VTDGNASAAPPSVIRRPKAEPTSFSIHHSDFDEWIMAALAAGHLGGYALLGAEHHVGRHS
jgi:hypothetical protein